MKAIDLTKLEKHQLQELAEELQKKLTKRTRDLFSTRQKLSATRARLRKMKDTVRFQRQRILELYQ
ncbi:MAG: hypothetical protein ABI663_22055 [Chryseolinea sp.]